MESENLLEISQTSQNLDIDLDIAGLELSELDITELAGFQYPAMVISNVAFNDTMRVLLTRARKSYRSCDVWVDTGPGNTPSMVGTLPLELETLLVMRYLGVRVTLYFSSDMVELLDLSDTSVLEKYI